MEQRLIDLDGVGLHVGVTGAGPDVVVLTGGPGCVQYLEQDHLAPHGFRSWYPEPRGVGRSGGGPHTMEQGIADLEKIRRSVGIDSWIVVGHSWGSDLAVRYAVECPESVSAVVGIAGRGAQRDRAWSEQYDAGRAHGVVVDIAWDSEVHAALGESFTAWIHQPGLWRAVADCPVPMRFVAAGDDVRPSWPMAQLAGLAPHGSFTAVPGVPHDFWHTHPDVWTRVVTEACRAVTSAQPTGEVDSASRRSNARLVADFHRAVGDPPPDGPRVPSRELVDLRASLIGEECEEVLRELAALRDRLDGHPPAEAVAPLAHELADLLYVTYGTLAALGLPADAVFAEVHAANMRKTEGPRRADGKQLKPEGWQPADVLAVVRGSVTSRER